ncbi:sigma-70 family RNA polymerase sigma factor [Aeoliella mucimassa]|uniref:ECF RNA polymerase sigma factor SigW n=1 Tax=Aeoliella mucimassa TaxID=2527972 RepID=A0A518AWK6_9BACT|nr:sigma-70 family RNA polymerase sigma factor [Aeoliella mucimassa]QDU59119.1 ECF RNA polymerase sigma factor SigW [Aeoliella mucimassa]
MADAKKLFEILVRENADMLTAYLRAAVRDAAAADDVFQETLLTAWRKLDDYDAERPFGPWLRGIAAKLVLSHYRQAARRDETVGHDVLEHLNQRFERFHGLPGDTFDEKLDALRQCVEQLPEQYREPVDLRYAHELSLADVGEQLALSAEALKKRLQRAKVRLLDCLNRRLLAPEPS